MARHRQEGEGIPPTFSLEQSTRLWVARWLAADTGIATNRQFAGDIASHEWVELLQAEEALRPLGLEIDDTGGLTVAQVRQRARRVSRQKGLSLIVVDHLNLMAASQRQERSNDTAKLTEITGGLKTLAKELDVPILALCQLNRGVEQREDRRPTLADLRQSGSIEQDADLVVFLYRHAYYLERHPPQQKSGEKMEAFQAREADHEAELARCRHTLELDVAKNRHGPIGRVDAYYDGLQGVIRDKARF